MHKEPLLGNNIMYAQCKIINICSLNTNTKELVTGSRCANVCVDADVRVAVDRPII